MREMNSGITFDRSSDERVSRESIDDPITISSTQSQEMHLFMNQQRKDVETGRYDYDRQYAHPNLVEMDGEEDHCDDHRPRTGCLAYERDWPRATQIADSGTRFVGQFVFLAQQSWW